MNRLMSFGAVFALVLAGAAGRAEATEYIYTTIDYPGATHTYADGINDLGEIVGYFSNEDGVYHAFILGGGVYTSFDHPSAVETGSLALGINSVGQIAGYYDAGWRLRGFLRTGDDYTDIIYPGDPGTLVMGINDLGQAVGYLYPSGHPSSDAKPGFFFDGTSYTALDDPDAVTTWAYDVNNAGVIVGMGWESTGLPHAFVRDTSGNFTNFYVEGLAAGAGGINDVGQIVGSYSLPGGRWGYVLTGGVNATPDKLVPPGATDTLASDINNLGQVIGYYLNASGNWHGFLATPIPDIHGDYNRNGVVDAADYTVWRDTLGSTFDMRANGDNSGASAHVIDAADCDMWRAHFGETSGVPGAAGSAGADAAIPEPASLLLAVLAATWLLAGLSADTKQSC